METYFVVTNFNKSFIDAENIMEAETFINKKMVSGEKIVLIREASMDDAISVYNKTSKR
jgi:hypothetical protein